MKKRQNTGITTKMRPSTVLTTKIYGFSKIEALFYRNEVI